MVLFLWMTLKHASACLAKYCMQSNQFENAVPYKKVK